MKIIALDKPDEQWKSFVDTMDKTDRTKLLTKINFIGKYNKHLQFIESIAEQKNKDMKYDRLRKKYDIRNRDVKELPRYKKSQIMMIQ